MKRSGKTIEEVTYTLTAAEVRQAIRQYVEDHKAEDGRQGVVGDDHQVITLANGDVAVVSRYEDTRANQASPAAAQVDPALVYARSVADRLQSAVRCGEVYAGENLLYHGRTCDAPRGHAGRHVVNAGPGGLPLVVW